MLDRNFKPLKNKYINEQTLKKVKNKNIIVLL